jgi:DtxR family Mn-dependent transcriptional regulator
MSESEEMYLVSIARLLESGVDGPVPLSQLAGELDVLSVSANQMIRKLEENGLVIYMPYKGVELTEKGRAKAFQVLRYRRLWEVFLVEHLKMLPAEAAEMACKMEHDLPSIAAERLAEYLGNPQFTHNGKPIPAEGAHSRPAIDLPLAFLGIHRPGQVSRISADPQTLSFLAADGLVIGADISVEAAGSRGNLLVQTAGEKRIHISAAVADLIRVFTKE